MQHSSPALILSEPDTFPAVVPPSWMPCSPPSSTTASKANCEEINYQKNYSSLIRRAVFCAGPIKRPNYFEGRLLSADDLTAEQNYQREKQRRHNLHCHGFGVIQGLKVSLAQENSGWTVVIEPGAAIDPAGNGIQLCSSTKLQLPKLWAAIQVGIRLAERFCDPVPTFFDGTEQNSQPSRTEEGCEVLLNPLSMPTGSREKVGRASLDVLPLAYLVRRGRRWQLNRKYKIPRAR